MKYIDLKYIRIMGNTLNKFSEKSSDLFVFRCPYCNDSQTDKNKTRGYIFLADNTYLFKCHNCGISKNLMTFIKDNSYILFSDYKKEKLLSKGSKRIIDTDIKNNVKTNTNKRLNINASIGNKILKLLSNVSENDKAYDYLVNVRKLPKNSINDLYYVSDINIITSKLPKYKDKKFIQQDAIVIPFIDKSGIVTHLQLRLFTGKLRYITLECEKQPRLYNINKVNLNETVYVFEGVFDSLFTNGIAVTNGNLHTVINTIKKYTNDFVLVYDKDIINNEEIYNSAKKSISLGAKLVLYDKKIINSNTKDINEMVAKGYINNVTEYLKNNTYSGFKATMYFDSIKQINKHKSPFEVL